MKKTITLLILFGAISIGLQAQSISPQIIAATGGFSANGGTYTMSYTVGEMTRISTATNGNSILTEGFQQPTDSLISGLLDLITDEFGSFVVYPNPASNHVWFGMQFPEQGKVTISIFNIAGEKTANVFSAEYTMGKVVEQADISTYAAGMYLMSASFTDGKGQVHVSSKKFQVVN